MLQDYSTNNKIEWKANYTGFKTIYVDIKDSSGKVVRVQKDVTVQGSVPLSIQYIKTDSYPGYKGSPVTISTAATGGTGGYMYKFLLQDVKTGNWYKISDFSSNFKVVWTPGGAGQKKIYVDVKDSSGKVVRSGIDYICY